VKQAHANRWTGLDRSLLQQKPLKTVSQDNPFPTFPASSAKQAPPKENLDQAMSKLDVNGRRSEDSQRRPMARGIHPDGRGPVRPAPGGRADSGQFEGNGQRRPPPNRMPPGQRPPVMELEGARGPPMPRQQGPRSPSQQMFGPGTQRSATMPQNNQQQWADPGALDSYHGPQSPSYIPPRPSTAGSGRQNGPPRQPHQQPPMPRMQTQQPPQHVTPSQQLPSPDDHRSTLDHFYDDYYEQGYDRKSIAETIDMPDFDAIPETSRGHRRGDSIDNHLIPSIPGGPQQNGYAAGTGPGAPPANDYQQHSLRSRSQPDLNAQYNGTYQTAADAPPMPAPARANTGFAGSGGLPSGPRGRGPPPRGMTTDDMQRGPPNQGYGAGQQPNFDPRYGRGPPPVQRGYSDDTVYSEPPMNSMRNVSSPLPGPPMVRPGTTVPVSGRMPSDPLGQRPGTTQPRSNPDALPAHPVPIRAGLVGQQPQRQPTNAQRPPPVRQYNSDQSRNSLESQHSIAQRSMDQRRSSAPHPVTHDELNRLRKAWKDKPTDDATGLKLAKKLVEAASVLADENGTADKRARDKNKEKFVLEAHKIIKKLAQQQYGEAMFYLADCYGQGQLGLQVDTKEAFTLYQGAAKAGHAPSAYRTAVCCEMGHEEGGGTKRDPLKAVQWYRRAAALGDTPALYKMGMILLKGLLGQQKNQGEAINMLQRATNQADRDNPHALHELALIYEQPANGNERIIPDEAYALQLFVQAADLGYKFSQFRLGQAYEYGLLGCPIEPRKSIGWYTKAAAQEEHQSELALSGWYLTGIEGVLQQSDTEAYLWARKAACAEPPLPKALFAMGYFTEVGIGCPKSLEEAKRWYGRAAGKSISPIQCLFKGEC
jgi:TPR repeat protein